MHPEPSYPIMKKRISFFAALILGLTMIIVTAILSSAALGVYGMRILDKRSDGVLAFASDLVKQFPELQQSLPPVFLDAISDERMPDYRDHLDIKVTLTSRESSRRGQQAVVRIHNNGPETVSLLGLRIIGLDDDNDPVFERNTWAATPMALDHDWRGPILPGETREFTVYGSRDDDLATVRHEVTELRIWRPQTPKTSTDKVLSVTDTHTRMLDALQTDPLAIPPA